MLGFMEFGLLENAFPNQKFTIISRQKSPSPGAGKSLISPRHRLLEICFPQAEGSGAGEKFE